MGNPELQIISKFLYEILKILRFFKDLEIFLRFWIFFEIFLYFFWSSPKIYFWDFLLIWGVLKIFKDFSSFLSKKNGNPQM